MKCEHNRSSEQLARHSEVTLEPVRKIERCYKCSRGLLLNSYDISDIIIHQTHYEKSDWSRAFNQFTIACKLDMITAISAVQYSGLKFRVFHATNGTVFFGSLGQPIPGHQVPSFTQKCGIKRRTLLPLFTCFGAARRL